VLILQILPVTYYRHSVLSPGVKRPGCEADHSPPSSAEVNNAWCYTSTSPIRFYGVALSYAQRLLTLLYYIPAPLYYFPLHLVKCAQYRIMFPIKVGDVKKSSRLHGDIFVRWSGFQRSW